MNLWRDSLKIGVDEIDSQHMELLEKIGNFMDACKNRQAKEAVVETLNFLKDYTVEHFRDEEQLMTNHQYPKLEEQQKLHKEFIQSLDNIDEQIQSQGLSVLSTIKLNRMLVDWMVNHISKMDRQIGEFLDQKK